MNIKRILRESIVSIVIISIFWITYAAVSQVSSWDTLTATLFNESMVTTWAIMAFNGTTCPTWWNKADWSGDEKNTSWDNTTLDLRWEFIRGLDDWRWVDSGRALASYQVSDFKSHNHSGTYRGGCNRSIWLYKMTYN